MTIAVPLAARATEFRSLWLDALVLIVGVGALCLPVRCWGAVGDLNLEELENGYMTLTIRLRELPAGGDSESGAAGTTEAYRR